MKVFISVHDERNLERFTEWLEKNGFEIVEDFDEEVGIVVVNLPRSLPRSERKLLSEGKFREIGILTSAALRYEDVLPVCDPDDYDLVIELFEKAGDVPKSVRRILSIKALSHALEYMARVHTRMSELFGMTDYVHHVWKVKSRIIGRGAVEEYLTDLPESVFFGKEHPLIPLYSFVANAIPKGSSMFFSRAVPVYATMELESFPGAEVWVHNGHVENPGNFKLVVAKGGSADVIVKDVGCPSLTVESSGVGYTIECSEDGLEGVERLASVFVTLSPGYVAAVFEDGKLKDVRRKDLGKPSIAGMEDGDVLATNFPLEELECYRYRKVIVPEASEEVRKLCGLKLISRRL